MPDEKHFIQNTVVISVFTTLSRILGLIRDMACATYFGGGIVWDAFSFAFRVPNLFRRLFGEGALNSAFIPVFTDYLENRPRDEAWNLAKTVGTVLALTLFACVILGEGLVFGIILLRSLTPRWQLALGLTAVLLPYLFFICLTAMMASILQSLRHFIAPAVSPLLLNICWIIAVIVVAPLVTADPHTRIFILAVGILIAGVFQLGLQLGILRGFGFTYTPRFNLSHPGLKRMARTMAPIVLGMAAFQFNVLLDGVIAIGLAAPTDNQTFTLFNATFDYPLRIGANSALYYANRLMQFPLGVFGIALATAIFPTLSSSANTKNMVKFRDTLTDGLGSVIFIGIPASAGLIILGEPAIRLLFERGEFTSQMSERTATVLTAYSVGIWAYCAHQVLGRAFYSLEDSITPMKVAFGVVGLNFFLNITLIWWLSVAGLALATAASTTVQSLILYYFLTKRTGPPDHTRLAWSLVKTTVATIIMCAVCIPLRDYLPMFSWAGTLGNKLLHLLVPLLSGLVIFFMAAKALRIAEMDLITGIVKSKLHGDT